MLEVDGTRSDTGEPFAKRRAPQARRVVGGLDFPTSVAFDGEGAMYIAESGLPFGGAAPGGRVLRIDARGGREVVVADLRQPVNGLAWIDNAFYISEGGAPGRISRWSPGGARETILDGLPARGNYHTNMVARGPDGWIYFSQGAMTNSGVVGLDAYEMAWLKQLPHPYDVPGYEIALAGQTFTTPDPLSATQPAEAITAAFARFSDASAPCARIGVRLPCTAAVMRFKPDGSQLELVAWGLRNAYGLGFLPDGRLLALDQGADDRGSRPIGRAPDLLYVVEKGRWYGWPDFIAGRPVTDAAFRPKRGLAPQFLLANHDELPKPERAVVEFEPNVAATKFAVAPKNAGSLAGQILVACFGDEKPVTAPSGPRVRPGLIRVDPREWSQTPIPLMALARPIDVAFGPDGRTFYALDFGRFEMLGGGRMEAHPGTGAVWIVDLQGETGSG
jgi:glucose/arabinose dehydrogenase